MAKPALFLGRYKLGKPLHSSRKAVVVSAKEIKEGGVIPREVAVKFMRDLDGFNREVAARLAGRLEGALVVPLLDYASGAAGDHPNYADHPHLLALDRADIDLQDAILHEGIAGDSNQISHIGTQLAQALASLHDKGIAHGDLKLQSFGRFHNRWKILDLSSSFEMSGGPPPACNAASASLPPEDPGAGPASPARRDLWALGAVLYHLCMDKPLFLADGAGKLDARALAERTAWSAAALAERLEGLTDGAARDALSWLLHPDAAARPTSAERVLQHAFFGGPEQRMSAPSTALEAGEGECAPELGSDGAIDGEGGGGGGSESDSLSTISAGSEGLEGAFLGQSLASAYGAVPCDEDDAPVETGADSSMGADGSAQDSMVHDLSAPTPQARESEARRAHAALGEGGGKEGDEGEEQEFGSVVPGPSVKNALSVAVVACADAGGAAVHDAVSSQSVDSADEARVCVRAAEERAAASDRAAVRDSVPSQSSPPVDMAGTLGAGVGVCAVEERGAAGGAALAHESVMSQSSQSGSDSSDGAGVGGGWVDVGGTDRNLNARGSARALEPPPSPAVKDNEPLAKPDDADPKLGNGAGGAKEEILQFDVTKRLRGFFAGSAARRLLLRQARGARGAPRAELVVAGKDGVVRKIHNVDSIESVTPKGTSALIIAFTGRQNAYDFTFTNPEEAEEFCSALRSMQPSGLLTQAYAEGCLSSTQHHAVSALGVCTSSVLFSTNGPAPERPRSW